MKTALCTALTFGAIAISSTIVLATANGETAYDSKLLADAGGALRPNVASSQHIADAGGALRPNVTSSQQVADAGGALRPNAPNRKIGIIDEKTLDTQRIADGAIVIRPQIADGAIVIRPQIADGVVNLRPQIYLA